MQFLSVFRDIALQEAIEFLKFSLFFLRTKHVNQKGKRGFPMMGRLYSFSHSKAKSFRMSFEKKNQSKKSLNNSKINKTLYQNMKITV